MNNALYLFKNKYELAVTERSIEREGFGMDIYYKETAE